VSEVHQADAASPGRRADLTENDEVAPSLSSRPTKARRGFFVGEQETLCSRLTRGEFRNIVVCTGAGISVSAGIQDFRGPGGLFEEIRARYGQMFPELNAEPAMAFSRSFRNRNSHFYETEMKQFLEEMKQDHDPTAAHNFCVWLHQQGWLRRVYTQNIDGLHAGLPEGLVVEAHGSLANSNVVMYEDPLPERFFSCLRQDFKRPAEEVDLMLVMGTALQVAPFCAVPNLAPAGCTRVLVNRLLADCMMNDHMRSGSTVTKLAGRPVTLNPRWRDRKAKWEQYLLEMDCDDFAALCLQSKAYDDNHCAGDR